ncbi:MAG: hypothetical protein ACOYL6_16285 [Bacteriovoracaceae bacterium]
MKSLAIISLIFFILGNPAYSYEIECYSPHNYRGYSFIIAVEKTLSARPKVRAHITTRFQNKILKAEHYTLIKVKWFAFHQIEMKGSGVNLSIDYWPDQKVKKDKVYPANYRNMNLMDSAVFENIECQIHRSSKNA